MVSLCEQLDAMLQLPPNWDGYGAGPIEPGIVDWAKDFVAYFEALQSLQGIDRGIRVYPSRTGGVQIEWEDSRFERELELNPDGSIGLLHVEKATGAMREETFRPGKAAVAPGFLLSLGEIATVFAQAA